MIFFVTLICFFNIEYINVYLGTSQNEIIDENLSSFDLTFIFSERDITKCYENNYNECFINLYIDEFKNNETLKKISKILNKDQGATLTSKCQKEQSRKNKVNSKR